MATGCTLWYLATDPFDGLGEGSDGGAGSADATSPDSAPDGGDVDCGALDTIDNCGACGVKCGASAECSQATEDEGVTPGRYQCGAVPVVITGWLPQALTVWGDNVYVLDTAGGVWGCNGTCDTDSFTLLAAEGDAGSGCYITASSKGLFWSSVLAPVGVNHIDFDGGPHPRASALNPQVVAAVGTRLAWTNGQHVGQCDAFSAAPGSVSFTSNPAVGGPADAGPNISGMADVR
ncbi:MAG: hypothetical protein ABI183_19945, partial [Polyangiaceae bacterium]